MKISGAELNSAQEAVTAHQQGPMLVVAGAGTGKTHVITERILALIDEGTKAQRILALTFTEKAASEMLGRIVTARSTYNLDLQIMTFNAFGELLLRKYATDIGISPRFKVLGENAKVVFLKQNIDSLGLDYYAPVGNPDGMLSEIADYFSVLKQNIITPENYKDYASRLPVSTDGEKLESQKHTELARAYEVYIRLCRQSAVIDYDDQIYAVIDLLTKRPNVAQHIQKSYDFIMIDEFQDTNPMQSIMIDAIVSSTQNLVVVGDDDQSIYGFRGANLSNILTFTDRYKKTKEVTLTENYRSTQQILDSSYALITHNNPHRLEAKLSINKRLHAQKNGDKPTLHSFDNIKDEISWIADDVQRKLRQGIKPGDIAIICRRNTTAKKIHDAFQAHSIDHVVIGNKYNLFNEPIVRSLIEGLACIADPHSTTNLYHALTGPLFNFSASALGVLVSQAKSDLETLYTTALAVTDNEDLAHALEVITTLHEEAALTSVGHIAYQLIERSGLKDTLYSEAENNIVVAQSVTRLSEYFDTLKEFEEIAVQPSVLAYLDVLPVLQASGEIGEDDTSELASDKVNVLTIHKSKGLEWEVVYVPDCTEGSFPLRPRSSGMNIPDELLVVKKTEADDHYSEERRLMYVAVTRAREELNFTRSLRHMSSSERKLSRFITEMDGTITHEDHLNPHEQLTFIPISNPTSLDSIQNNTASLGTLRLSVSMIDDYLRCPRNYYYKHILRVPQEPQPQLEYGTNIHGAIEKINLSLQTNEQLDIQLLVEELERDWPKAGYLSKAQRTRAINKAKDTVVRYFETACERGVAPTAIEMPFKVVFSDADIELVGRFDAIYPYADGVEIVDYKTSPGIDTDEKAKTRASSSTQLTLYALAWQKMHDELPKLVSLEFVESNKKGSIKKTERGIVTMESKIYKVAEGIRKGEFPEGTDHRYCIHPLNNEGEES